MFIFRSKSLNRKLLKFSSVCEPLKLASLNIFNKYFKPGIEQHRSYCSSHGENTFDNDVNYGERSFEDMVEFRRAQSSRSYLVQVYSEQSCGELFEYCDKISPVKSMFHYALNKSNHFVLLELSDDDLNSVLKAARFMDESETVPVFSNMLWFKAAKTKRKSSKLLSDLPLIFASQKLTENELNELLLSAVDVSDQIKLLYETSKLDEVGTRLRFFTASQLELALSGLFPFGRILPFGSSVNGFGKMGCDLDLVFQLNSKMSEEDIRLIYQGKAFGSGTRLSLQRQMELIADILHVFLPGISSVRRILQARVPIVKYCSDYTGVECDLSLCAMSGVYMSEILYLFGSVNPSLRPLVLTVKRWASAVSLTSPSPGRWITNFSLTSLVIFYLQSLKLLPSIELLVKLARPQDRRFDTQVTCTFLREPSLVPQPDESNEALQMNLESLLRGFFEFYSSFPYDVSAINVFSGAKLPKPDHSPLYIVNPLERSLNVSRNVSGDEVERLKMACRNALWLLEDNNSLVPLITSSNSRFQPAELPAVHNRRIVRVKDLFAE